jgi:hypothetical protein
LDRIIDAVRPESLTARDFHLAVNGYLGNTPWTDLSSKAAKVKEEAAENLRPFLKTWVANHKALEPILEKADLYNLANQSRDLATISKFGLEALDYLKSGKSAPASWQEKAAKALERAQQIQAEVEIAVISPIRKLTLAAGQLDKLKGMKPEEWNQSLEDQVKAAKRRSWE